MEAIKPIRLLFTGDCALTGCAHSSPDQPRSLHVDDSLKSLFHKSDLTVVNLETPLTKSDRKILKSGPHLKAHPDSVGLLKELGVNVACLSNNHIRDYGDRGVIETIDACLAEGIQTVGAGKDLHHASQPLIVSVKGKKIAILNFSETEFNVASDSRAGSNPDDPIHIWRTLEALNGKVDFTIAVMHGGKEMHPYPTPLQMRIFRFVADLGADAVIGHHSHVIGGYEIYNDKPIVYSLGNFLFDDPDNIASWYRGSVVELVLDQEKVIDMIFYQTFLEKGILKVIAEQNSLCEEKGSDIFMIHAEKKLADEKWEQLIEEKAYSSIKSILNLSLFERILIKLKLKKVQIKNFRPIISNLNRLQCRTHREYYSETIKFFLRGHI